MTDDVRLQDDPLLKPSDVAALFGVQPRTIRAWINSDKLKAIKIHSGRWRIAKSEVDRVMTELYGGEPK